MIAMIDDSKVDDRANCFESIGFHMAQLGKPLVRRFHSRHLMFAVALMGVGPPGLPQLPYSWRSSSIGPSCKSHSIFSSPVINLANRITAHVTWTIGQSSRCYT